MHTMKTILTIISLSCGLALAGSPDRARQHARAYDAAYAQWVEDVSIAPDNDEQNAAWLRRPNGLEAGRLVWEEIRGNLADAWMLEHAAWFLTNVSEFAVAKPKARVNGRVGSSPAALIRDAVFEHHLRSPKVGSYCIGLTHVEDPQAMRLLEMVEKVNKDHAVRGAAALAQAILHRRLGGGKFGMRIRQEKLRIAIKAPDLTVGKTTTLAILDDEVFRMTRLNMSTVAPDFRGIEVTQKISSLSDNKGKVMILFFWHSLMPTLQDSLALFRKYREEFEGKDIVILGVNMDNPLTLREHIAEGTVTWKNFSDSTQTISKLYRIETWPFVYVLDEEHKIRYSGAPGAFVKITAEDLEKQLAARKAAVLEKAKPGE
ncbi:MAG: peroxiredoxin Q/BCP [Akkermansiaceae bacterium]|jgi:peroxiredoxin Q/BCP|tara:strand:- start:1117 stop:2238 length:1122 start_codon:yes stop_codon:yes gene_type:complete